MLYIFLLIQSIITCQHDGDLSSEWHAWYVYPPRMRNSKLNLKYLLRFSTWKDYLLFKLRRDTLGHVKDLRLLSAHPGQRNFLIRQMTAVEEKAVGITLLIHNQIQPLSV